MVSPRSSRRCQYSRFCPASSPRSSSRPRAQKRADDVPRHAADAEGRLADAEPGRPMDALHAVHARLEGGRAADRHLSRLDAAGLSSTRQMTFTNEKNETSPRWARDGSVVLLPVEPRRAGERAPRRTRSTDARPMAARRASITDAKDGVVDFAFSQDGKWLVYRSGKCGERAALPAARSRRPRRPRSRSSSRSSRPASTPGSGRRTAGASTSRRRHASTPTRRRAARRGSPSTSATRRRRLAACGRWTSIRNATERSSAKGAYSVVDFTVSDDGKWVGFRGGSTEPLQAQHHAGRTCTRDLYLLETATGQDRAAARTTRGRRERRRASRPTAGGSRSRRRTT